jgi:DNA-binding response OmpR family regulator
MKHLLVVAHDPGMIRLLKGELTSRGYRLTLAINGEEVLQGLHIFRPDLVVIDAALPDRDGIEVCRRLRQTGDWLLPILLVSPSDQVTDKVAALDSGADDFITRPFDCEELAARIRAALRRVESASYCPQKVEVGDLVLDATTKQVWRSGEPVPLTRREYELLGLLALNAGRVLTRGCIFERVWGCESDAGWEVIKVYVNYVRAKLNAGGKPNLIHAVRGVGYMLKP